MRGWSLDSPFDDCKNNIPRLPQRRGPSVSHIRPVITAEAEKICTQRVVEVAAEGGVGGGVTVTQRQDMHNICSGRAGALTGGHPPSPGGGGRSLGQCAHAAQLICTATAIVARAPFEVSKGNSRGREATHVLISASLKGGYFIISYESK